MVDINGYEIKSAFSGGEPLKAIYSLGEKVWPVAEPATSGWLCFTALEDGEIGMEHYGTNATTTTPKFSYSKDGINWIEWDYKQITVSNGDVVYFKGVNNSISSSKNDFSIFTSKHKISGSGNIMSLLYGDYFEGKFDLSGKDYCFYNLFYNSTGLTTAPELPATTLGLHCYSSMFSGCRILTEAPSLPSNKLGQYCYSYMFEGCESLTNAPKLPSTTLEYSCYYGMFDNCTSLKTAPSLPATKLEIMCYYNMFSNCTSLTTAPKLPATIMKQKCYGYMFAYCTSLTTAPKLPATKLDQNCYEGMFYCCDSLIYEPELPATNLSGGCYRYMFYGCTGLTDAPSLPATKLVQECYNYMFKNCTNLDYVIAKFTTKPSVTYTAGWLSGVSSTGTFAANKNSTWDTLITRGSDTVPAGWNIVKY